MIAATEDVVNEMVKAIVREVSPEKIIMFGSMARGEYRPDSDIDLIIVEKDPFGQARSRHKELIRIRKALSPFRIPKDILVYSAEEMERWKNSINHILAVGLREGKLLYERP